MSIVLETKRLILTTANRKMTDDILSFHTRNKDHLLAWESRTTEEYYTPNHNKINKEGITPDVEVDLTKNAEGKYETEFDKDAQVKKAIETIKTKIK